MPGKQKVPGSRSSMAENWAIGDCVASLCDSGQAAHPLWSPHDPEVCGEVQCVGWSL